MRLLHTSDWHLGKRLFKLDRSEEHALFLNWLIETLIRENIDVLLIAGDIFDTPTPPHQSLELFYRFLHRVSTETKAQTLIIAGNHDSGVLLEAPSQILAMHRVKVWGKLSPRPSDHWLSIRRGEEKLDICAIPFFRSYELLPQGEGDILQALGRYLTLERSGPQLLMLHHLAGLYEAAGSEQVISLSGIDSIPAAILKSFDYVALGHIHKPQKIGPNCYYSGSPLPMRFSETLKKSLVLLELKDNQITSSILPLPVFRDLVSIKANGENYVEKLRSIEKSGTLTPVVEVQLSLSAPRVGVIDHIKQLLEEKEMELLSFLPVYPQAEKKHKRHEKLFELSPLELFEEFYAAKYPDAEVLPVELEHDFRALLEKVKHASAPT
ncbi:MAG TPA: exonuclease SbcCD subunit D C-terminal domain-containing protein [Bacteriovoracaceae bacterium]|nr:exonuclease SbcCD subunit D C-terminal domain-containing protein [Bacteriovoracaceae bacterium]